MSMRPADGVAEMIAQLSTDSMAETSVAATHPAARPEQRNDNQRLQWAN